MDVIRNGLLRLSRYLLLALLVPVAAPALAQTGPAVNTVPWVAANPLIPHDTWSGREITVKGTADVQGSGFEYTWDFGDGTPVVSGAVSNRYVIEARHTYVGDPGEVFSARLTVLDTATGETGSDVYFVQIRPRSLEAEVNVAIDEGLWNLHRWQTRSDEGGVAYGDWRTRSGCVGCSGWLSITAANINAFAANGHVEAGESDNPYSETVQRAMRRLFTYLVSEGISNTTYPDIGTVNPDSNGNGRGVRVNQSQYPYQGGMFMDAIITAGRPESVTTTGATGIVGRTYAQIVQDMVDSYAFGQYNTGANRGGWRYVWNQGPDNSAAQWAAIGLIPAERNWGLTVPDWVKEQNAVWLGFSQTTTGTEAGRFGYTNTNPSSWGPYAVTPSGMVQMVMDGIGRGDARWDRSESWLRDRFANTCTSTNQQVCARAAIRDYYYGLFSFVKSMRLHEPPIELLRSQTAGVEDLDWYGAQLSTGDSTDGVARTLVNEQRADGGWSGSRYDSRQEAYDTAWAILMLGRTLFQAGSPVAVAQAIPNPAIAGQAITLDARGSFHQDRERALVAWEWDLDNDGSYETPGPVVSTSYGTLGDFPVGLRVTDDSVTPRTAETTLTVRVTTPPVAPTAEAGGPYSFCPGQSWFLDGTGSVNPDEGLSQPGAPGDTIQGYAWDLDGDGTFSDALLAQPDVTGFFSGLGVGDYLVRLRVTDTTASAFPGSGLGDLSDTDAAQVRVRDAADAVCVCISDLSAGAKPGKVEVLWTDTGAASYNVYRGTSPGGPYTRVANTESRYSVYVDHAVVNGTTYYYVIREVQADGTERCQSVEASARPEASRRRPGNGAPLITSTPPGGAVEGMLYSYDVEAQDPDGDTLGYALDLAPAGMTIEPVTGLIGWTPANAQVGTQTVTVRASDPAGASTTQTWQVLVVGVNAPPAIVSAPLTAATEGQAYRYALDALDPDVGDVLGYSLDSAPAGMTVEPVTGLIEWTPGAGQIGPNAVTARVTDAGGLFDTQTFTVLVAELNRPPAITSTPVTGATQGVLYTYAATASDPNAGDTLTFSLDSAPAGMTVDALSGLIEWTPGETQVGANAVELRVSDAAGLSAVQGFTVTVVNRNDAPTITSTPVITATQDQLYGYDVEAADSDVGETLTFSLDTAPAGMAIDAASGLIAWTPVNAQVGANAVAVRVTDSGGLFATQAFSIAVLNVNDPPAIVSTPVPGGGEGELYSYDVEAVDPDVGDTLTFSLDTAPAGMTINPASGLIEWTPGAAQTGLVGVVVRVSDAGGLFDTQGFTIDVTPAAALIPVPDVVGLAQAEAEADIVAAGLAPGVISGAFSSSVPAGNVISQQPLAGANVAAATPVDLVVSLGPPLVAVPDVIGQTRADAETAVLAAGLSVGAVTTVNSNTVPAGSIAGQNPGGGTLLAEGGAVDLQVSDGPDVTLPVVQILTPANSSTVSGVVDITGTADDANLSGWVLDYAPLGSTDFVPIASDTVPVTGAALGQWDTTGLRNDFYQLRLSASDDLVTVSTIVQVGVDNATQPGQFDLVFEDLSLPGIGFDIVLRRVYDTRDPSGGDFGRGWHLGLTTLDVSEDAAHNVFITLPDDRRVAFAFTPIPQGFPFNFLSTPAYTAAPGVYDTLTQNECGAITLSGGVWFCFPGNVYTPDEYVLLTKNGTSYTVSDSGAVQRVEDRNGNFMQITPNGVSTNFGRDIAFLRDPDGRIVEITDPNGNVLNYRYDTVGRLIETVDQAGEATTYDYFGASHLLTSLNAPGACTPLTNEYGPDGRLLARRDAAGNTTTYAYDDLAGTETVTDARGNATTFTYGADGKVSRVDHPGGGSTFYFYDADGNEAGVLDPSGRNVAYTYDDNGNRLTETREPAPGVFLTSSYTYNAFGRPLSFTSPAGDLTTYTYDGAGNLLTRSLGGSTETFTYDALGNRLTAADALGNVTTFAYDGFGNLVSETDPLGNTITYEYDLNGNRIARTDALGNRSEFAFDAVNRLTSLVNGGIQRYQVAYNDLGLVTQLTDANNAVTDYGYDCLGNLVQVNDADANVSNFAYDAAGNLVGVGDALGNTAIHGYDEVNRQTSRTDADGANWNFAYAGNGYVTSTEAPGGDTTVLTYDGMDRVTRRSDDGLNTDYIYDAGGRLSAVTFDPPAGAARTSTFSYDLRGNPLTETDADGRTTTSTYDATDRRTSLTTPDGLVTTYTYDAAGRITAIATGADGVSFVNDAAGRRVRTDYSNGARAEYAYDSLDRLTSLQVFDAANAIVAAYTYTLDGNGLRTDVALADGIASYDYDPLNRLIQEQVASTSLGTYTATFDYDAAGNRLDPGATFGAGNRLLADAGGAYTYDTSGNVAARGAEAFGYDTRQRLTLYSGPLASATYAYDYAGRRTERTVNGVTTEYLYDGDNVVAEYDGTGTQRARYTHGLGSDEILMVRRAGQTWFYHTDGLGSVVAITDAAGNVVHNYGYDAWGNIIVDSGVFAFAGTGLVNTFTYTGREYDAESGLYYLRARAYDPRLGRFLQKDALQGNLNIPQTLHLYAYVQNNPVNFVDPSGRVALLSYALILTAPTGNEIAAAVIGFGHGFGSTNLVFIAEFLGLVGNDNGLDIVQLWDQAIARTKREMNRIKSALGIAQQASSALPKGVAGIPGAFKNGVKYEVGFKITLLPKTPFSKSRKFSIERSGGGFVNGVEQGLNYLQSLRPTS